jgi:hypothetical protein
LPELAASGVLKKVKVIIMEWHFKNPDCLAKILNDNGFVVFRNNSMYNQGTIRAVKI